MFNNEDLNRLYRYCYSLTTDETSAYDLLQSSLEKFLGSPTPKDNEMAFVYRIIRNHFIDDRRRQNVR